MIEIATPWERAWRPEFIGTLLFLCGRDADAARRVLLIHKKRGHGAGRVNAPGGKLQQGESVLECALRETAEEVGIELGSAECRAELRFVERDGPQWLGFAFVARVDDTPRAIESDEARPFWCAVDDIPYDRMWPDDRIWLPRILAAPSTADVLVGNFLFEDERLLQYGFVAEPSVWETLRLA